MENPIACLFPFNEGQQGYATRAVTNVINSSRLFRKQEDMPDLLQGRSSRESTGPLDENEGTIPSDVSHGKGLQLTFTHGPKTGPGFVLGSDSNCCDIVLPRLSTIGLRHCFLTFDAQRRLIVRDCSTHGTSVKYDGKGGENRRNFTWIIGGHKIPDRMNQVVIEFHPNLKFRLVVSKPLYQDIYLKNVDDFLQEMSASEYLPFGALGIQRNISTVAPSGPHTANQDPILLELDTLGEGSFSTVSHVWDVSTGLEYASKKFHNISRSDWRQEAYLMQQMSHEHLVRLHFMTEHPSPQLVLEYLPLGNLHQQHHRQWLSADEMIDTLVQILSALSYLHEQTPPIVHRDIKPENILVKSRDPFHIKLGDFGLSKASEELMTFCGTGVYLAPEVSKYYESGFPSDLKYTRAVDIWSLGVVIFQYVYDLPQPGKGAGRRWCQKIADKLNDLDSDGLVDLLSHMIAMEPEQRHPARKCWENALTLERPSRSPTPTPDSHSSFVAIAPQADSTSPTEKASTIKLYENLHGRSKRQRSPERALDEPLRNTKPFSQILSITNSSSLSKVRSESTGSTQGAQNLHL